MRLLYMSGHDEDDIAGYGVAVSGGMFLPKPFTVADLTERGAKDPRRAGLVGVRPRASR
jgi:hypothetical protein